MCPQIYSFFLRCAVLLLTNHSLANIYTVVLTNVGLNSFGCMLTTTQPDPLCSQAFVRPN